MRRSHLIALMALIVAVPAATAGSLFSSSSDKPCFIAGNSGYRLSAAKSATYTVRIDNAAAKPGLRMQLVNDPAEADFVLVDDTDTNAANACRDAAIVESIRIDPAAVNPELTVSLSRAPAAAKIYVKSTHYSEQDAAALFAVIWLKAEQTGSIRSSAHHAKN